VNAVAGRAASVGRPTLLERETALSRLRRALQEVRGTSQGRLVFVGGEAGIGKTALLRRFREEVASPTQVLWCGCDPLSTPRPLGPLLAAAEAIGGPVQRVISDGRLLHEAVAALAQEFRDRQSTVLVLEDAHWGDEATLDVVRLLTRRIDTVPVLALVSFRDDELDRRHPLRLLLGELATNTAVQRLTLNGLSLDAIRELARPMPASCTV
jgi:predicted ATPase